MKKIFILILFIYTISCKGLINEGLYKIKNNNKLININTYYDGIVYKEFNNKIIKILNNSQIQFQDNSYQLKNGAIIVFNKKGSLKKIIKKSDIKYKIFFNNLEGNCQFFRLELFDKFNIKGSNVKILYHTDKGTHELNVILHKLFKKNNLIYYGFFIPFNLYWDCSKYQVEIEIYDYRNFYSKLFITQEIKNREWQEQVIYFKKTKSIEIAKADREKFKREKTEKENIWKQNNKKIYFNNGFYFPLDEYKFITSEFGLRRVLKYYNGKVFSWNIHSGLDFWQEKGTVVFAPSNGIVKFAKNTELFGNTIIIEHGLSLYSDYSHLDEILVKEGMYVNKGQIIGKVGMTGAATGPHLHWGTRVYGFLVDPRSFLNIEDIFIP